jgi:hypothetical protein
MLPVSRSTDVVAILQLCIGNNVALDDINIIDKTQQTQIPNLRCMSLQLRLIFHNIVGTG